MKKLLFLAALLGSFLCLTACGGDDEPKLEKSAQITYYLNCNELTEAANVIVYYVGDDGLTKFEALAPGRTAWTKTITVKRFPAKVGFQLALSVKESSELTKATYNVKTEASIKVQLMEGTNIKGTFTNNENLIGLNAMAKDKVLSNLGNHDGDNYGYSVSSDGSATRVTLNLK